MLCICIHTEILGIKNAITFFFQILSVAFLNTVNLVQRLGQKQSKNIVRPTETYIPFFVFVQKYKFSSNLKEYVPYFHMYIHTSNNLCKVRG